MNIYLVGYRCSGKTVIGKKIALKLNFSFFDVDQGLLSNHFVSISEIVYKYGWNYFRSIESKLLKKISSKSRNIISTGGGICVNEKNIILLRKYGIVVWLDVKIAKIKNRILENRDNYFNNRPSLTGYSFVKDIDKTFNLRKKIYQNISDLRVSTNDFNIDLICDNIIYFFLEKFRN